MAQRPGDSISAARQATIIFTGAIAQIGAATMDVVPVSPATAVVEVHDIISAPPVLGDYRDKKITVLLLKPEQMKPGERRTFYTEGWMMGQGIAVREVASSDAVDAQEERRRTEEAKQAMADQQLKSRIDAASLVVLARVERLQPALQEARRRRSEHDPEWWEATLVIEETFKGRAGRTVTMWFPNSRDVMWYRAPKAQPGQTVIWILSRTRPADVNKQVLTALDPLDVQPRDQSERVRALAKAR